MNVVSKSPLYPVNPLSSIFSPKKLKISSKFGLVVACEKREMRRWWRRDKCIKKVRSELFREESTKK